LNLAEQASLRMALIQNGAGEFIKANRRTVAGAAVAGNKGQGISRV
jgi:hypothetical protein